MVRPVAKPLDVVVWKNGRVRLIDQTLLPTEFRRVDINTPAQMHDAIKRLVVRGAPAIGVAAAYGVLLGFDHPVPGPRRPDPWRKRAAGRASAKTAPGVLNAEDPDAPDAPTLFARLEATARYLAGARPTAVNLFYALDRVVAAARGALEAGAAPAALRRAALAEARAVFDDDRAMGGRLARFGRPLVRRNPAAGGRSRRGGGAVGVLTHCNAGRLASSGHGLALAPVYAAHAAGLALSVYSDETRPLCQGARLTCWELTRAGLPVTLICDNMAAQVMREGRIDLVMVGADRIAANGDTANKIGTYGVAVLARHHGIPFYVVAPSSTFDLSLADGGGIPIEQRDGGEIRDFFGRATAPARAPVYNPAFDVTPAELIDAIVTDRGVLRRPTRESIARLLANQS